MRTDIVSLLRHVAATSHRTKWPRPARLIGDNVGSLGDTTGERRAH
jgi:hypothetical protein